VIAAAELLGRWGIPPDAEQRRPERGTNNTTLLISHNDARWVLRISQNLTGAQVAAEHRLLGTLRQAGLPFAVPEPVAALDGRTVIETESGPATLCRWLPGVRPDLTDLAMLTRFGTALGQLSVALRDAPAEDAPHDWRRADPLQVHPAVSDVPDLCARLEVARVDAEPLRDGARRVMRWWDSEVRAELPSQIVHGDFAASNMLIDPESGQVSAVLDFEIAGTDFRIQDPVASLGQSGALDGPDWERRVTALMSGYRSQVTLSEPELLAIPDLVLWRSIGTVLWRSGRWLRGQDPTDLVADRIEDLARSMDWLDARGQRLVSCCRESGPVTPS
jgi:Ser/Thr protein kinase RdoA (MazF antagonist)